MTGSIMPAGLADELTRSELVDLVRFLSELGKVGPYAVGTRRVCRRWEVLEPTPEARDALARVGPEGVLRDGGKLAWRPAYTMVNGFLPPSEWDFASSHRPASATIGLARTQIQVTTGGRVKLLINSTKGLSFYLDSRRVEPIRDPDGSDELLLDLKPGTNTLEVAITAGRREGIRWILEDVPGSPARAQVVLGK